MEAKERGEEYQFDNEEGSTGAKHSLFLLIMTAVLVIIVLLKVGFMIFRFIL